MVTMIERVAWAMLAADYPDDVGGEMEHLWWDRHGHTYLVYARSAIEAMREPTEQMAQEGGFAAIHHKFVRLGSMNERDEIGRSVFTVMIDAALKEGP